MPMSSIPFRLMRLEERVDGIWLQTRMSSAPIVTASAARITASSTSGSWIPGIDDAQVLEIANSCGALLLTSDKDFGELVFPQRSLCEALHSDLNRHSAPVQRGRSAPSAVTGCWASPPLQLATAVLCRSDPVSIAPAPA